MDPEVMANLAKSVELLTQMAQTQKAASTTLTPFAAVHGPGGILSYPNQRAEVVNAMALPRSLWMSLPARLSNETNPIFPILTGITDSTGEQPDGYCADCKTAGNLKVCNQMYPFGRLCLDSRPIQLDTLGVVTGRGEMRDQVLIGNPFVNAGAVPELSRNEILRNNFQATRAALFASWYLEYAPLTYSGLPTNNTGGYAEFYGLDRLINDGKVDALTGVACPSADSRVIDFGDVQIDAAAADFVTQMSELYRAQKYLAAQVGMPDMTFAWVMRYSAFIKATEVWACTYLTYRCATIGDNSNVSVDAMGAANLLNGMRAGNYLLVDGQQVPVIIDDSIAETIPENGVAESSIYLIPLRSAAFTHNPGGAVTYWEFQDMRASLADITPLRATSQFFQAINGGTHLLYEKAPSNLCIQFGLLAKPRLIVEAPFLAGRIDGVRYQFINHERNAFPDAAYYHVNGGSYYAPDQYFYAIPA